uniref:Uncharacterized protein n=1 Tax=Brassica oleracea var. oleracea TaxID=109376 RepID=A0A0D3CTF6_BRAOL
MVSNDSFSRRLGGLYCLYCLHEIQPFKLKKLLKDVENEDDDDDDDDEDDGFGELDHLFEPSLVETSKRDETCRAGKLQDGKDKKSENPRASRQVGVVPRTGGSSSGLAGRAELLGRLTGPILHFLGPYEWA